MCYVTDKKIVYHVGNNEKTDHAHLFITDIMYMIVYEMHPQSNVNR